MDFSLLKVVDLKQKLREKGLKTSGAKTELILRLQDSQDIENSTKIHVFSFSTPVTTPMSSRAVSPVSPSFFTAPTHQSQHGPDNNGLINMDTQTDLNGMSVMDALTSLEEAISSTSPTLSPNIKTLFINFKSQMMKMLDLRHLSSETPQLPEVNKKKRKRRNRRHITPLQSNRKPKCYLIGDSHLRGFSSILHSKGINKRFKIESHFQPGAGLHEVADVQVSSPNLFKPSSEDIVILYCGTNDICQSQWSEIQSGLNILIEKFAICSKFYVVSVPIRFDNNRLNKHIARFNTKLKSYIKHKLHSAVFVNNVNKQQYYSHDGIHLNQRGKNVLCEKLVDAILDTEYVPPTVFQAPPPLSDILYNVVLHKIPRTEEQTQLLVNNANSSFSFNTLQTQLNYVNAKDSTSASNSCFYSERCFPKLTSRQELDFGTSSPKLTIT